MSGPFTNLTRLGAAVLLAALLLFPAPPATAQTREPVRVHLLWHHQAQFAGIYVADNKGFYEREGIRVELIEGGPGVNPLHSVVADTADVALTWLPAAIEGRMSGWRIVNIAQVFRHGGTAIICRRDAGVNQPADVTGKYIGAWHIGDEMNVRFWLRAIGVPLDKVSIIAQPENGRALIEGYAACVTAMMYNEYWSILQSGLSPANLMVKRLSEEGIGFLEDGFYASQESLDDPRRRDRLARFLRATAAGWAYAAENVDEAHAIVMDVAPKLDPAHQRRMLQSVLNLIGDTKRFGLLDLESFNRSVNALAGADSDPAGVRRAAAGAWTHGPWYESGLGHDNWQTIAEATRYRLVNSVSESWLYMLALIGTANFALAGFMHARRRHYDIWGAFILTLLPAAGGGILRDLLVGGDRHPPFIFKDPAYIFVILSALAFGVLVTAFTHRSFVDSKAFERALTIFDTAGLATFTVVGAQVALIAELHWIWVPICAALTCAGGGMLLDIVTGREPRTFLGEPYEEIAVAGGLILYAGLQLADRFEHTNGIVFASIAVAMTFVFTTRTLVVVHGWRSFRLGHRAKAPARRRRRA